jgi:hypothetical protein
MRKDNKMKPVIQNPIYDENHETYDMEWLCEIFISTYLDGTYQRLGGVDRGSGWTLERSRKYILALLFGFVKNEVMIVKVDDALRFARGQIPPDQESIKYFTEIQKKGNYEYVSIDGNNSTSTINAFYNDELSIPYPVGNGTTVEKKFSELSRRDRKAFERKTLRVWTFRRISIVDMCNEFRIQNEHETMRNQEWRQARWSELSKFIRYEANSEDGLEIFTNLRGKSLKELDKRGHEEVLAQHVLKVEKNYKTPLNKKALDDFYEAAPAVQPSTRKSVCAVLQIVANMSRELGDKATVAKFSKGDLFALFDIVQHMVERKDITVNNALSFFEWFVKTTGEFKEESKAITEENQRELSFSWWLERPTAKETYPKVLNKLKNRLLQDEEALLQNGTFKKKRTSADVFSDFDMRKQLHKLQGGKDRDGNPIPFTDIYTNAVEIDHVKSVKDGGATVISNAELMSKAANRSKGSKSNSPHFDHQGCDGTIFIGGNNSETKEE